MSYKKIIHLPKHKAPVLHEKAAIMSFENCYKLGKIYKEIIGLNKIGHFSINIVDKDGKMSILSYNPQIAYNIFKDGSYLYNGSISPTFYENFKIYSWEETYDPHYFNILKNNMERKNGINQGIVITEKFKDFTVLFSFATKKDGVEFTQDLYENTEFYSKMGHHCLDQINPIIESYLMDGNTDKKIHNGKPVILRFPKK